MVPETNWLKRIFRKQKKQQVNIAADRVNRMHLKADDKFIEFAEENKFKKCTKCKFWVEKSEGCNQMTCRCGYEFCYVCGAKLGTCKCPQFSEHDFDYGEEDVHAAHPFWTDERLRYLLEPPLERITERLSERSVSIESIESPPSFDSLVFY